MSAEPTSDLHPSAAGPSHHSSKAGCLPRGATVNPDGSITLALSNPVAIGRGPACGASDDVQQIDKLTFHRMSGATRRKLQSMKTPALCTMAKMLGMAPAQAERLKSALNDHDFAAAFEVMGILIGDAKNIPARADTSPGGGYSLPLLYPVSVGQDAHRSLEFSPLAPQQVAALPRPGADKFMAFALHHATRLPLRVASALADDMDAADCASVEAVLAELIERTRKSPSPSRKET